MVILLITFSIICVVIDLALCINSSRISRLEEEREREKDV